MYKLFLSIRYLKKLLMAWFAVLSVALCVAMMLIVISVMNGFLDKIESAAKGLFGDIIIEAPSLGGVGRYDELIAELKQKVPQVKAATPYIVTYGILEIPRTNHRQTVQVTGIRLPERVDATGFGRGLFVQKDVARPTFDPPIKLILSRLEDEGKRTLGIIGREQAHVKRLREELESCDEDEKAAVQAELTAKVSLCGRLSQAMHRQDVSAMILLAAAPHQEKLAELQRKLNQARAKAGDRTTDEIDELSEEIIKTEKLANIKAPANHLILGLGLPAMSFRTAEGESIRVVGPGEKVVLSIVPLGRRLDQDVSPQNDAFTVVDDCWTDVSTMDARTVYVPFETLQRLNNMHALYSSENSDDMVSPARCGQIHIKVAEEFASGRKLIEVRNMVLQVWEDFYRRHPDAAESEINVMTWRQRQRDFIGPIEKQRTLTVIMFGIISLVSVVLIFVIFYMIVYQKIRDIGVLKAIGASSMGVAQIFLAYGAAVGLVGSILGTIMGYYFVRYINGIQNMLVQLFGEGARVFSREVFLFERIPNEVRLVPTLWIVAFAILFGLLGAIVPAIQAARKQPVEALRYE